MCPDDISQLERLAHWEAWRITPDFFHSCDSTDFVGVPHNQALGFQPARSGQGYIGLTGITQNNLREIAGIELVSPLVEGEKYYFEMHVSRTFGGLFNTNCNCSVNNLGASFFTQSFDFLDNPAPITNSVQVVEESIISDTTSWTKISGWFIADSAYSHLGIGNFFDIENCDLSYHDSETGVSFNSYYYIDDVCVATDPSICDAWNSISEQTDNSFNIFQPNSNSLEIRGVTEPINYKIYDSSGRLVKSGFHSKSSFIDISTLKNGIYLFAIKSRKGFLSKRFLKK